MSALPNDLMYAARTLRRSPGFALITILTLALGIGASTAIFSVVNAVLLRPLPYKDPERLVLLWGDLRNRDVEDFPLSPADFYDLREQATLLEGLAAVSPGRLPISGDDQEPEQIRVAGVTTNFFKLLGARVAQGRDFEDADGIPPAPPPAPAASQAPAQPAAGAPARAQPAAAPPAPPAAGQTPAPAQ